MGVYKNDLQFFIGTYWEFITYLKDIKSVDFDALKLCLNALLGNQPYIYLDYPDEPYFFST